jgi:hypothetical protein
MKSLLCKLYMTKCKQCREIAVSHDLLRVLTKGNSKRKQYSNMVNPNIIHAHLKRPVGEKEINTFYFYVQWQHKTDNGDSSI